MYGAILNSVNSVEFDINDSVTMYMQEPKEITEISFCKGICYGAPLLHKIYLPQV